MAINFSDLAGGGGGGGRQPREQYFYNSDTWVVPEGVTSVEVTAVGGGGSAYNTGQGAYGGSGGVARQIFTVVPEDEISVVVGAGAVNAGATPNVGGVSSFGNLVIAAGGAGVSNTGSESYGFGSVYGQVTNQNGMDYCIPQYPVGNTTVAESYSQIHTASVAGDYAFLSLSTNSWEYTYIPDPSIRGNTGSFTRVAESRYNAQVKYGDGYYYFWHNNTTNSTYHSRIVAPATPSGMTDADKTYFSLPAMREYVPAFNKLIMPKMDGTADMFVSEDRGSTWTSETATITGETTSFQSYGYMNQPHFDGNFMVFVTESYWYTSSDGVNFIAHSIPYNYNNTNSGFVNKVGPRTYVFASHRNQLIYYKTVEFNETYTSFTKLYEGSTANIGGNSSTNYYNPGQAPYGWTAYQNYSSSTWACFGGDSRGAIDGYINAYSQTNFADPRQYTFQCRTAYDYATDVFVGVYDYGSAVGGYMVKGAKTIGLISGFSFNYSGTGNGGIGAGGKGAISKWVSTYERTLHSPGPGLYGFSNGAGNGLTPGTGAVAGSDAAQNGLVLLRWWQ